MYQKSVVYFSALILIVSALDDPRDAKILDYQSEHASGHYFFRFESSDGTIREEEGNVLDPATPESPIIVKGSYSYTDSFGKLYTVRYIADENGFHPEVPTPIAAPIVFSSPRPQYIATTPRPRYRPEIAAPTRIQIPLESTTQKSYDIDPKLQETIVGLISNGRGFSATNSI